MNPQPSESKQGLDSIPHSGNLPAEFQETPVNNFDNTTLSEAVEAGHISSAPDDISSINPLEKKTGLRGFIETKLGKVTVVGAGLLTLGGIAGGIAAANNGPEKTPIVAEQPVDENPEAPVEEAPTDPESVIDVEHMPENVVEHGLFTLLSPEQQDQIRGWEAMSVDEFRSQPIEDQLTFAQFVYDNNLPILKYRLDETGGSALHQNASANTPEGALKTADLKQTFLSSLKTRNETDGTAFDKTTAHKVAVIISTNPDRLEDIDARIETWSTSTPAFVPEYDVVSTKTDSDGNFVIVTRNGETESTAVLGVREITNINGESVTDVELLSATNN